jgi:glucosamine-6-phosphate deaminase
MMSVYVIRFQEFSKLRPWKFTKVTDVDSLNQLVADEVTSALKRASIEGRRLMVICPVGPLNYSYWADLMNREQTNGAHLVTVNMDEYVDESGRLVIESHPLSFRRFMKETFFDRLRGGARVPEENIHFPSPKSPELTTQLIEVHGGADLCYGGMGLTGHFAFNDPPRPDEPCDDDQVRNSRTRVVQIGPETQAQMCMGGTGGNWEVLPKQAITLGMYELLMSKSIHLTFMRSWHAGVMRRALFGEVTGRCPGSFIQQHKNVQVTATELAAALPMINVAQRVAE